MTFSFEFIYTFILLFLMTVLLIKEWLATELVVFGTMLLLLIGKIITIEEAFTGFSNTGVLTIALLL